MEQPYSDVAHRFVGRGADAPARYAEKGNRPEIADEEDVSESVRKLIRQCWHADAQQRPTFAKIVEQFQNDASLVFKNQFDGASDAAPELPAATVQKMQNLNLSP